MADAVSDVVTARGVILPDGTWLAHAIDRAWLAGRIEQLKKAAGTPSNSPAG